MESFISFLKEHPIFILPMITAIIAVSGTILVTID